MFRVPEASKVIRNCTFIESLYDYLAFKWAWHWPCSTYNAKTVRYVVIMVYVYSLKARHVAWRSFFRRICNLRKENNDPWCTSQPRRRLLGDYISSSMMNNFHAYTDVCGCNAEIKCYTENWCKYVFSLNASDSQTGQQIIDYIGKGRSLSVTKLLCWPRNDICRVF